MGREIFTAFFMFILHFQFLARWQDLRAHPNAILSFSERDKRVQGEKYLISVNKITKNYNIW